MGKKNLFWFLLVMAFTALPLNAQNAETGAAPGTTVSEGTVVFAPFVSHLQGELRNNLVRLSWVDSPHIRGPVYIYRSSFPFDEGDPFRGAGIKIIEIPYGAQSFIDEIDIYGIQGKTLYYFAAASEETGRSYDIPISFTNTVDIEIPAGDIVQEPAPRELPAAAETRTLYGISSVEAAVQGDRVIITFNEGAVKNVSIYRSTRPIRETQDLLGSVIIQTKISSPFTDSPVPGIPYYYAVISEEDLVRGAVEIVPGLNVTRSPVEITTAGQGDFRNRDIRAMPLPLISAHAAIPGTNTFSGPPAPAELSAEAAKALGNIPPRSRSETVKKKPRVFARDLDTSNAGIEEYALGSIIRGSFSQKNWNSARDELVRFLALPRSAEINARSRFYLGQCYYFLHQNREALFEFLAIQDRYPSESREWIEACLTNPVR